MILGDLFESRMSDLDIQYQDWKNMSPVAFHSRYKMTKDQWYAKHQSLVPAEGGVQEGRAIVPAENTVANAKKLWQYVQRNLDDLASNSSFDKDYNKLFIDQKLNGMFKTASGESVQVAFDDGNNIEVSNGILYIPIEMMYYYRRIMDSQQFVQRVVQALDQTVMAETTARERWNQASAEREKKHSDIEARRQAAAKQGKTDVPGAIDRLEKALDEEGSHRFKGPHGVVDVDQSKPGVTKVTRHSDVGAKTFSNNDHGRASGIGVGSRSGISATQGTRRAYPRLNIDGPELSEQTQELSIGDPVIIQGTEYNGKTGEIGEFSPSGKFVVVDLYNYGPQAFSLANVKYNEYADEEDQFNEEQDACYRKVKSRYKVWPSAYASGALVQCRKKGAANWGNKSKK